jgi:site-specific DNA-methyltransferase (adenine-specific)
MDDQDAQAVDVGPAPYYQDEGGRLYQGDVLAILGRLEPECSVDAVVTDPPYGLEFMGKEWDSFRDSGSAWSQKRATGKDWKGQERDRPGRLYMRSAHLTCTKCGKQKHQHNDSVCDPTYERVTHAPAQLLAYQLWTEQWARELLRVLKPGAYLLAFGGTRTYHRLTCGIEDAGFEVRDCLSWLYGSGFPKSLNLGDGRGTALKPAWEPIVWARKPLAGTVAENVERYGTGALNIDAGRIPHQGDVDRKAAIPQGRITSKARHIGAEPDAGGDEDRIEFEPSAFRRYADQGATDLAALPGERGGDPAGRWPTNVALGCACDDDQHDDGCAVALLDAQSGRLTSGIGATKRKTAAGHQGSVYGKENRLEGTPNIEYGDSGGASRFFYVAKATRAEREAWGRLRLAPQRRSDGRAKDIENPRIRTSPRVNDHPTVKPIALMEWLLKLVVPEGGLVLDPFCGSGTTLVAAKRLNIRAIGIDKDKHSLDIARERLAAQWEVPLPLPREGPAAIAPPAAAQERLL